MGEPRLMNGERESSDASRKDDTDRRAIRDDKAPAAGAAETHCPAPAIWRDSDEAYLEALAGYVRVWRAGITRDGRDNAEDVLSRRDRNETQVVGKPSLAPHDHGDALTYGRCRVVGSDGDPELRRCRGAEDQRSNPGGHEGFHDVCTPKTGGRFHATIVACDVRLADALGSLVAWASVRECDLEQRSGRSVEGSGRASATWLISLGALHTHLADRRTLCAGSRSFRVCDGRHGRTVSRSTAGRASEGLSVAG